MKSMHCTGDGKVYNSKFSGSGSKSTKRIPYDNITGCDNPKSMLGCILQISKLKPFSKYYSLRHSNPNLAFLIHHQITSIIVRKNELHW